MTDRASSQMPRGEPIESVIEIPRGSRNKYEMDEARGVIRLDRVLYASVHYPTDYGFIPETLAEDGDHLDILVLIDEPTFPGCRVPVIPIGVLNMLDYNGEDQKIMAVAARDPRFERVADIDDISPHWLVEIRNFFESYKSLERVQTEVLGWDHAEAARRVIEDCRRRFGERHRMERES